MARKNPAGIDPDSFLAQLDKKLAAIKEATREANESIQGIKEVIREAKQYRKELNEATQEAIDTKVADAVAAGLETFKDALDAAIDGASERTYRRFDQLTELLLGEDQKNRRQGNRSIAELTMIRAGVAPHKYNPMDEQPAICLDCRFPFSNKEVHPE
jgi:uncharacterized phage infection (PIP) family protein YhgE